VSDKLRGDEARSIAALCNKESKIHQLLGLQHLHSGSLWTRWTC
jgi:hypothetical protein